jgi:hypothetical protein
MRRNLHLISSALITMLISSDCWANEINYACQAIFHKDSDGASDSPKPVKFRFLIVEENGHKEINVVDAADLISTDVALSYVAGSCVSDTYPICDIGVEINDNHIVVNKTKYTRASVHGNIAEVVSANISLDRRNGKLHWTRSSTEGERDKSQNKGSLITIKGRCSIASK